MTDHSWTPMQAFKQERENILMISPAFGFHGTINRETDTVSVSRGHGCSHMPINSDLKTAELKTKCGTQ